MRIVYNQQELQRLIEEDIKLKLGANEGSIDYIAIESGIDNQTKNVCLVSVNGKIDEEVSLVVEYYEDRD